MLRISKLTDYGSVILAYMACNPNEKMSAARLASGVLLPPATVSKLLKVLVKSGLLHSSRGKQGGYQLARPADKISLAEIISVLEGPIALTECSVEKGLCRTEECCDISQRWQSVNQIVYQSLAQVSLQQMLPPNNQAKPIFLSG